MTIFMMNEYCDAKSVALIMRMQSNNIKYIQMLITLSALIIKECCSCFVNFYFVCDT